MSLISVKNLTFGYEGSTENVFENVSFQIDTAWRLGFTGRNGRGKTTFLKLLAGEYAYTGEISASVEFTYFPYAVSDESLLCAEVAEEICPAAALWEVKRELGLLHMDFDELLYRPFCTLSKGEQTRLLLALLFLKPNAFLLIDEPTNHLDIEARAAASDYLQRKSGFIAVSHDRAFLDSCTDHTLSVNKTEVTVQAGNFSQWLADKERRDSFALAENERLQKEIGALREAAARTAAWSNKTERSKKGTRVAGLRPDRGFIGHKSAKMMKRSKALEARLQNAISEKEGLLKDIVRAEQLTLHPLRHHAQRLLDCKDVSIFYDGKAVCKDVCFTLEQGERAALLGGNGTGKSSMIRMILGENIEYSGQMTLASGLQISYVPQDASFLKGTLRDFAEENIEDESLFKAILRKLDFSREQFSKNLEDLSAGQQKKILLAKSLSARAHLYIFDEPLNFIDVLSRMQLEEMLAASAATVLFAEHDSVFTARVATKTVDME